MGKIAIFMVLALAIALAVVGYSINQSKTGIVRNVAGFQKYSTARNIAHSMVNLSLRALDRGDAVFRSTRKLELNLMGGTGLVNIVFPPVGQPLTDSIELRANSRFMDTTYMMRVRLHRSAVPFPTVGQAVGLRVPNVDFDMDGATIKIFGWNHDINGVRLPPSANDKPAVGIITPADSMDVIKKAAQVDGTRKWVIDPNMSDPGEYLNDYINAANVTYGTGVYGSNMTWGSIDNPWIVYANGDVKFTGNIEGWGILVVRGNIELRGNFKFRGLVICHSDVVIDVSFAAGTPEIIGAVLMSGPSGSQYYMKGDSKVKYSSTALSLAQYSSRLLVYRVISWYE